MQIPLEIRVAWEARSLFPELRAWAVAARWPVQALDPVEAPQLPLDMHFELEALASHPRVAIWREAYRRMGLRPSEYRSSVEQLLRRALRGEPARTGIPAVDLYNSASVEQAAPMGGYDLDLLRREPLLLRRIDPADHFDPLGAHPGTRIVSPNLLGYCQGTECLCWALNHRDSRRMAIRITTSSALFASEALDDGGYASSLKALRQVSEAILTAGGEVSEPVEFSR